MMSEKSFVIWFTGLSGSGKSVLADMVCRKMKTSGLKCERLDGDVVRKVFPKTGFLKKDRDEHIRKMGFIASLLERNGIITVCSFISPYSGARGFVRDQCINFFEIYLSTPLEVCEKRDVKGLYKKARKGGINNFTGISAPYEKPQAPDMIIDTTNESPEQSLKRIWDRLTEQGYLK